MPKSKRTHQHIDAGLPPRTPALVRDWLHAIADGTRASSDDVAALTARRGPADVARSGGDAPKPVAARGRRPRARHVRAKSA